MGMLGVAHFPCKPFSISPSIYCTRDPRILGGGGGGGGRERVLFIGTQFSILYTSMYSPAEAATYREREEFIESLFRWKETQCGLLFHDSICALKRGDACSLFLRELILVREHMLAQGVHRVAHSL